MKKEIFYMGLIIIILTTALSGCQEQAVTTEEKNGLSDKIFLESNLVELANASLKFITEEDFTDDFEKIEVITQVDITYRFHNIAGRDIKPSVKIELYDKDGYLIESMKGITLQDFPDDYTEKMANKLSYNGAEVQNVDHVKIIVFEEE